jgi:hypothetical protein
MRFRVLPAANQELPSLVFFAMRGASITKRLIPGAMNSDFWILNIPCLPRRIGSG